MWPIGLLFLKTSPVKQFSYANDFCGIFDALDQIFLVIICAALQLLSRQMRRKGFGGG